MRDLAPVAALPIDALLPQFVAAVVANPSVVVQAAPGAGKTTRLPPALLGAVSGEVLVLEPRRVAARLAARRVAAELGEVEGRTVGYQVRFERVGGDATRLWFVTEGVLTRRLISDPDLRGVDAVVLDEFHERHLDGDLALALLRQLQRRRPELRLVVMSATLESAPVAAYLGDCPVLRSEGRAFPVEIRHRGYSPAPLEEQVRAAVHELLGGGERGHILVFLPGVAEIRRAERACASLGAGLMVSPLHGELSPAEQDRALAPSTAQKLILATNIAESSLTIEGVSAVVDSGLARIPSCSPWTGLPRLEVARISRASATQRAGRAGRTSPGRVVRLFAQEDLAQRRAWDEPEMARSDLAQLCLTLRAMGIEHPGELDWLNAPPEAAVKAAEDLLSRLGVHTRAQAGELARFPLSPRLARVLQEARRRGVVDGAATAMALVSAGAGRGDVLEAMAAVEPGGRVDQAAGQLRRLAGARGPKAPRMHEDELLKCVLAGFGDRVARRRGGGDEVTLAGGVAATLASGGRGEWLVALDAEDRSDRPRPVVTLTSHMEPDWLIELFPERMVEARRLEWHRAGERVEEVTTLEYDGLILEEWREPPTQTERAAEMLAEHAVEAGLARLVAPELLEALGERCAFAGLGEPDVQAAVRELAVGLRSLAELRAAAQGRLLPLLEAKAGATRLRELAPESLRLPGGRQVKVRYAPGRPPSIASRLQDFFGMRETPRIGPLRTPVVVELLAPNGRAVQTTTDLGGFWARLYPEVRRELMRRYPRHSWPEAP